MKRQEEEGREQRARSETSDGSTGSVAVTVRIVYEVVMIAVSVVASFSLLINDVSLLPHLHMAYKYLILGLAYWCNKLGLQKAYLG